MLDMGGVAWGRGRDSVDSELGFYCILDLVLPCSSIDDALHLILPRPPYLYVEGERLWRLFACSCETIGACEISSAVNALTLFNYIISYHIPTTMSQYDQIQALILQTLDKNGEIPDSRELGLATPEAQTTLKAVLDSLLSKEVGLHVSLPSERTDMI